MADSSPRPASNRTIRTLLAAILLVAVGAGAFGLWYLFFRPSGPAAVADASLPPVPSLSSAPLAAGGVSGTWNVDTSIGFFADNTATFVGYRVRETLASIGANTAVGRTPKVSGSMTIDGTRVTAATITADLTALKSDDDRRDGQLRQQGIQTGRFPTATFKLTSPIELGSLPADRQEISAVANGELTLHGVTKSVQLQLTAKRSGNTIVVQGSLPIVFADYGIQKPTSFTVLSIEDQGTMELQIFFVHA
jgi:polyisoprenoid-binding protein YceI